MDRRTALKGMGVTGVVAAALTAAGCSASESAAQGSGAAKALTVGMPNGPQTNNSNPFVATSSANSLGYRYLMYEPLAQVNLVTPDAEPTPWLATAWEWSEDNTSVVLTIREGVTWTDGEDLTAEDVAYTFTLIKETEAFNVDAIPYETVTVSGNTVELTFATPQYVNRGKVLNNFVVPEHVWSKKSDPTTDTNQQPVGSGPYTLKSWTAQAVTMVPNDGYWGGEPPVPEIRYTSYNDNNAQTTALTSGKCQWSWVFMPNHETVYVAKDPEHNQLWTPTGLGIDALWINHTRPPFDNVALRRAMNDVIDRQAIHAQGHAGLFPLLESPTGIPLPAGEAFIAEQYQGATLKVDVDRARKTLTGAGFTLSGEQLTAPDGKPVTLTLSAPSGWSDYLADLQIIANNLKQIGVKATIETATADAWTTAVATGEFGAVPHWTNTGATPWDIYANIMDGQQYKPVGGTASWNFGRYQNEAATKALADYATTADEAVRTAAMATLQDIMVQEVPAIPLVCRPIGAAYTTQHWVGWPSEEDPYAMPQPTQPSASQIVMQLKPAS